jgi:hypothetical protein
MQQTLLTIHRRRFSKQTTLAAGLAGLPSRTPLGLRQWHLVVLVRRGSRATVYLDGQPDLDGELPFTVPPGETAVFLGGRCDNFADFEGKVDEVAVYDRALTDQEVAAHYQASRA